MSASPTPIYERCRAYGFSSDMRHAARSAAPLLRKRRVIPAKAGTYWAPGVMQRSPTGVTIKEWLEGRGIMLT